MTFERVDESIVWHAGVFHAPTPPLPFPQPPPSHMRVISQGGERLMFTTISVLLSRR